MLGLVLVGVARSLTQPLPQRQMDDIHGLPQTQVMRQLTLLMPPLGLLAEHMVMMMMMVKPLDPVELRPTVLDRTWLQVVPVEQEPARTEAGVDNLPLRVVPMAAQLGALAQPMGLLPQPLTVQEPVEQDQLPQMEIAATFRGLAEVAVLTIQPQEAE
jgi:hypothetical protein